MTKPRFVTYITYDDDDVRCLTHQEFLDKKATDDPEVFSDHWDEWVWQFADSKEQAIAQHFVKMDEWYANLDRETY